MKIVINPIGFLQTLAGAVLYSQESEWMQIAASRDGKRLIVANPTSGESWELKKPVTIKLKKIKEKPPEVAR